MNEKEPKLIICEHIQVDDELQLRALQNEDADKLFELTDTNRRYLGRFLPWVEKTHSTDDSLAFIKSVQEHRAMCVEYGFGIILSGQLVGHISLMHLEDNKEPEIGYWIKQSESGKGITKKVARALSDFGLITLELDRILIRARLDNIASNKIAGSLGYVFEGVHEDENGENLNHWYIDRI